jgi:hypothetical protein
MEITWRARPALGRRDDGGASCPASASLAALALGAAAGVARVGGGGVVQVEEHGAVALGAPGVLPR